jgi:hypothetical protein
VAVPKATVAALAVMVTVADEGVIVTVVGAEETGEVLGLFEPG